MQLSLEEADLERLRANLIAIEGEIAELAKREETANEAMRRTQSITGSGVADVARFRTWVTRERKALKSKMAECRQQVEARSLAVSEARRKVRLVERLKERRQESWTDEFNFELEQLAGESALSRWRRDQLPPRTEERSADR
jgi:flagellar biosynthesis chaperone FliJ